MGIRDDTAAKQLAGLHQYFLEYPITGPAEIPPASRTASVPLNLGTVDHIHASVQEVVDHTRTVNPAPEPLPRRVQDVYAWCRANTQHADAAQQQRRETIIYRQYLEHAIRAGEHEVIPPHRCPSCRTWGLMWMPAAQRAVCTNLECVTRDGTSNTFTLARLAYEHVAAQTELARARAT